MRVDDSAVSELLGYTVLVAIASMAAIGLMSVGAGTILASEKSLELSGATGALDYIAREAYAAVETNNTFYTVQELDIPGGYDLIVLDGDDDYRSLGILIDDHPVALLRTGSVCLHAPFRSATFEGGAVISNDTGNMISELSPRVLAVRSPAGRDAVYITLIAISGDTTVYDNGPVTLGIKCDSVRTMNWHIPDSSMVGIRVASENAAAWESAFARAGFDVRYEDGALLASSRRVSDVHVTYAMVDIRQI